MYRMNSIAGLPVIASLLLMLAAWGGEDDAPASVYDDCSRVEIEYEDDGKVLTAAERTARMDKAFYESLARFERCQTSLSSGGGSDAGGGNSGASGGGESGNAGKSGNAGDSGDGSDGSVQSVPSSSVSGTEPDRDKKEAAAQDDGTARETALQSPQTGTDRQSGDMPGSGKLPDDIPPSDNDSVLEAQIRAAAEAEKDPEKREKLWNEYRRYKNLPARKSTMEEKPE